jgi:TnpA family transposase
MASSAMKARVGLLGTAENANHPAALHQEELATPNLQGLCRTGQGHQDDLPLSYLHSEALRREIHEGLNVVKQWNGAMDFMFFARRGEMGSNRREDHEISMLALHLIQNCMVYVNTLMIQKVLAQPHWQGKLTPSNYAALTPLIWEHVNPYGPV